MAKAQKYFDENVGALIRLAKRDGARKPIEQIYAEAAQATHEQLTDAGMVGGPAAQAAPAQAQQGLSARPSGAPTTGGAGVQSRMSPSQFESFIRSGK